LQIFPVVWLAKYSSKGILVYTYGKRHHRVHTHTHTHVTYTGVMLDSLDGLDSTVGGVATCTAVAGVVARGVDVFFDSGVSVPTHGRLLPVENTCTSTQYAVQ